MKCIYKRNRALGKYSHISHPDTDWSNFDNFDAAVCLELFHAASWLVSCQERNPLRMTVRSQHRGVHSCCSNENVLWCECNKKCYDHFLSTSSSNVAANHSAGIGVNAFKSLDRLSKPQIPPSTTGSRWQKVSTSIVKKTCIKTSGSSSRSSHMSSTHATVVFEHIAVSHRCTDDFYQTDWVLRHKR